MAFSPSFTVAVTSNPQQIVLTDSSSGSDANIVSRSISIFQSSGAVFTPAIAWPLATNPITINPLTQDIALNIVTSWLNSVGATLYTTSLLYNFSGYGEAFAYTLVQTMTSSPTIVNDKVFFGNFLRFRALIDGATTAINNASDVQGSQLCINQYNYFIVNQAFAF